MKTKKILFLSLATLALLFSSCKTEDPTATGVTLDQVTLSVMKDDSASLKATIVPKGAKGTVVWASSNSAVATVKDGVVKGITLGTANITATVGTFSATCAVTVVENTDFSRSLKGTEYYPISMDDVTFTALGSKVIADLRPNGGTRNLYIWPDGSSYAENTPTGPNLYGEVEEWVSLKVGTLGWSGAGFNVATAGNETALASMKTITDNPSEYYLHLGIKSRDNTVHAMFMDGQTQNSVKFAIGATGFVDGDKTYPTICDFSRDGEWHEIEIPMTTLVNMGLSYSNFTDNPNILSFLSGGTTDRTIDLDAVFIYKK
ncbi:MAG TPA: Ig-like domain-containing protein [Paludibacter sp.]|nr:Ig-like domain-containing protein [Paludibacter sp.]